MLSGMKLDPGSAEALRDMEHVIGQVRSSAHQQKAVAVKENIPFSLAEETSRFQQNRKLQHSFRRSCLDPSGESRPTGSTDLVTQPKYSENIKKTNVLEHKSGDEDDDELIKHMSNLPGFLQQVEKENSIKERALNFGVLEWKRLEKWKYTERMPGKSLDKTLIRQNSCSASVLPKPDLDLQKLSTSRGCSPSSLYSGTQPSLQGSHLSSRQRQPQPLLYNSHLISSKEQRNDDYHKEEKYAGQIKSKGMERYHLEFDASQCSIVGIEQHHFQGVHFCNQSFVMNVEPKRSNNTRKERVSEKKMSLSSSGQGEHLLPTFLPNKIIAPGKNGEMLSDDAMKSITECCSAGPQNIVLLVPKNFPDDRFSESSPITESRTSLDEHFSEVSDKRLSDFISAQGCYSGELSVDMPHSCPLPSAATVHSECSINPHNLLTSEGSEVDIGIKAHSSTTSSTPIISKGKRLPLHKRTASTSVVDASKKHQASIAKQPIVRGRASSPTSRFSFDLGKISRSFSFKENSAAEQSSSTCPTVRPGQVRPEVPSTTDSFEKGKENASSRGRSSPLRRLLDPLLKYKGAQSAEIVRLRPPSRSLLSEPLRTTSTKGQCRDKKPGPTFQALLQITLKNGLPSFKLVVDNSEDMLAAAAKRLPASEKSDPCMLFSFYSVHEIRKKSVNWIIQGSKTKTCSLGYDIVGQMKISNSSHPKVKSGNSGECNVKECVLYGIDPCKVDQKTTPEFVPNSEIAAIIVNYGSENLDDGEFPCKNQLYKENKLHYASAVKFDGEENKNSRGPVVILPGGIHGTPITGSASSLISRWTSGGLCDCGGWDVGCKLRILTVDEKDVHPASRSDVNRLNLFLQGEDQKTKPSFSLQPLGNGLYSVELDASISLLEAFATCVAYVTCMKYTEIIDERGQYGAVKSPQGITGTDKTETTTKNITLTFPPLSPAGRI